jgi:hypothetical protein
MRDFSYNHAFLIVLYDKTIEDSQTYKSLLSANVYFEKSCLVIWNNGPSQLNLEKNIIENLKNLGISFIAYETLENASLSFIYNQFINYIDSEKYIFLDDDSLLNEYYLKAVLKYNEKVMLPIIRCGGNIVEPRIDNIIKRQDGLYKFKNVLSIGSGLVINNKIIEEFLRSYVNVFDKRFIFYGVDTTFFYKLSNLESINNIMILPAIDHSLSRMNLDSNNVFRQNERSTALALYIRFYEPPIISFYKFIYIILIKITKKICFKKDCFSILNFIKCYIFGRHERYDNTYNVKETYKNILND